MNGKRRPLEMGSSEGMKAAAPAGKGSGGVLKGWAQRYLNLGFVAGFLLVLLTYIVVSQQYAVVSPTTALTKLAPRSAQQQKQAAIEAQAPPAGETTPATREEKKPDGFADANQEQNKQQQQQQTEQDDEWRPKETTEQTPKRDETVAQPSSENGKVVCHKHGPYSDTCDVDGDVRTNGTALSVFQVPATPAEESREEWKVVPYARRTVSGIPEVTVAQLGSPESGPRCTVTHDVPAIVFALGGLVGNYWHDFSDVLVPLFVASRRYGGEVQLLVSNIQPWWLGKYDAVVRRLSRYDAVDFDRDTQVRCFPHVTVGLRLYKEFSIVPEWAPGGLSMVDFTRFLRETYALPRAAPLSLKQPDSKRKPRLMLLHRGHYRKFVNAPEIVAAAEKAGFEVAVADPRFDVRVEELARSVNSFDVLMGVHGAGLTNAVFLPEGAVVIQVVPYGKLEHMAKVDFGDPVADMGLRYLEYSITAEESTLLDMLGPEHPVIKDPESVHRSGWDKVAEYYLGKQDVRVNIERFAPTLELALDHLRQQQ